MGYWGCYLVIHLHVDLPHPKYYQAFGSVEKNQDSNHEVISKYHMGPFVHGGTNDCVMKYQYELWVGIMMIL